MNSSLIRACKARGRYIHFSKGITHEKVVLAPERVVDGVTIPEIAIHKPVVSKHPGITRFTDRARWERLGKRGILYEHGEPAAAGPEG